VHRFIGSANWVCVQWHLAHEEFVGMVVEEDMMILILTLDSVVGQWFERTRNPMSCLDLRSTKLDDVGSWRICFTVG
jgi:hypothetical protein